MNVLNVLKIGPLTPSQAAKRRKPNGLQIKTVVGPDDTATEIKLKIRCNQLVEWCLSLERQVKLQDQRMLEMAEKIVALEIKLEQRK